MSSQTNHVDNTTGYEIRIEGHLDRRWTARLDGLSMRHEADGTTVISGPSLDQAALHGLLQRVRDLSLPLISVTRLEPEQPSPDPTNAVDTASPRGDRQVSTYPKKGN